MTGRIDQARRRFPFADWWAAVLRADGVSDRDGAGALLHCVFCGRDLEERLRASVAGETQAAMMAWWTLEDAPTVRASGLYCHGRHACLDTAEAAGHLLDTHAERCTGRNALPELQRVTWTYLEWDAQALRRLVLVFGELARLPSGRRAW